MTKLLKKLLAGFMGLTASVGVAVGLNGGKAESVKAADSTPTYLHVFTTKPTGDTVTLSGVSWTASNVSNLGSYNSGSYAGVQIGSSSKTGSYTLTSAYAWGEQTSATSIYGKTKITKIELWMNTGGSDMSATVSIGGYAAASDGTKVVKNSSAGSDYSKATKVTYAPATGHDSGVVQIAYASTKAGYICAIGITCEGSGETVEEPEPISKTVSELLSLSPSAAQSYTLSGSISKWYGTNSNGTQYGNFYLSDGTNEILVYGATAKADSMTWNNVAGSYSFTNPKDFLTNTTTKDAVVGSTVSMKGFLTEHDGVNQFNGIVTSVTNPSVASITATCNKESVNVGDELASSDFTVEATLTSGAKRTLDSSEYSVSCSTSSVGQATATIKYIANDSIQTTCKVNVIEALFYYLVTDVSQIADGSQVIFVAESEGTYYGMKNYDGSSNNLKGFSPVVVSNSRAKLTNDFGVYTVSFDGDYYAFKDSSDRYLYASSTSSNQMKAQASLTDNGRWNVSISEGLATITSKGNTSRGKMRFNPNGGSPIFACYASTTSVGVDVAIYASSLKTVDEDIQDWIDTFLYLDEYTQNLGYCADEEHGYYAEAKEAMLFFLSEDKILEFQSNDLYADAYARYVDWAKANGDATPFAEATSSSRAFLANVNNDSMSLVIIVSVGLMVTAISYALLNKKKKLTK